MPQASQPSQRYPVSILSVQLILLLWSLGILVFRWSSGLKTDVPMHFTDTLLIGNLLFFLAQLGAPLYAYRSPPWDWLWYLPLLAVGSILASSLGFLASELLIYGSLPAKGLAGEIRSASVTSFLAGVGGFTYFRTKRRLQAHAKQLQVQYGELQRAREMQDGLLPKSIPQIPGFQISAAWKPAAVVSGDYYDLLLLDRTKLAVCVGDVVGKGMSAALLMANLQAGFHAFATLNLPPSEVCNRLNQLICSNVASGKFITFIYVLLDGARGKLTVAHAGHCRPIWLSSSGEPHLIDDSGAALGLFPNWIYQDFEYQFTPGDVFILYTDGVVEAQNASGEEFGEDRILQAAQQTIRASAAEIQAEIMRQVGVFCSGNFHDDATVIVIKAR